MAAITVGPPVFVDKTWCGDPAGTYNNSPGFTGISTYGARNMSGYFSCCSLLKVSVTWK